MKQAMKSVCHMNVLAPNAAGQTMQCRSRDAALLSCKRHFWHMLAHAVVLASHAMQQLQAALRLTIHHNSIDLKSYPNAGHTVCLVLHDERYSCRESG